MIAVVIGSLVLGSILATTMALTRGSASLLNYVDMNDDSRAMLEQFARDIRMGNDVTTSTESRLVFTSTGKNPGTTIPIIYNYVSSAGTLFRTVNGVQSVVLNDIQQLEMRYFDLAGNPTTNALEVKEVQIEAIMRKKALSVDNTNHIITARFMMRNRTVHNGN